jgi:hypothetical protein
MVAGDIITQVLDTNPGTLYYIPAVGVKIMITSCGSDYQGLFKQYDPSVPSNREALFIAFDGGYDSPSPNTAMKVFIDNTYYLEVVGTQTCGWTGVQVE